MLNNNFFRHIFITAACIVLSTHFSFSQDKDSTKNDKAGEYSLVLYAGGGWTYYLNDPGTPAVENVQTDALKSGVGGSLRVMWHPDHLLRLGLETGRIPFYSYTIKDNNYSGEMSLSAVPIMLEWSMPIGKRFNTFLGYGIYIITSKLDYAGTTISSTNSLGFVVAANYIHPLADNLGLAGEVKYMNAAESKDKILNFQIQLVWRFLKW